MNAVELFGGAGGLALGVSQAGFNTVAFVENDRYACETIRGNQLAGDLYAQGWPLFQQDVREFDYSNITEEVDLLCAGVPCQPFSVAGRGHGDRDARDMFSEVVRAASELRPKAIVIENVKGLLRPGFRAYLDYLRSALTAPQVARSRDVSWREHARSLKERIPVVQDVAYTLHMQTVNAADYGVPQRRERVFIIAFRSDLNVDWEFPAPTYSLDSLIDSQFRTEVYWRRHGLNPTRRRMTGRYRSNGRNLSEEPFVDDRLPWLTVRDAIADLPPLSRQRLQNDQLGHYLNPGARPYHGHSGSYIDEPAKTLKAGAHGVGGGENSLVLSDGHLRYFSIRECARLQTFPDKWRFAGPWSRAMRQIGNAVPVRLAHALAAAISKSLFAVTRQDSPVTSVGIKPPYCAMAAGVDGHVWSANHYARATP